MISSIKRPPPTGSGVLYECCVLLSCHQLQVSRIAAQFVFAQVIDFEPIGPVMGRIR